MLSVDALTGKGASLDVYACDLHAILGVSVSEPTHCTVMDIPYMYLVLFVSNQIFPHVLLQYRL